jgi:hypothetical protein
MNPAMAISCLPRNIWCSNTAPLIRV